MHHVAERMGVAVEDCLVIGDREDTDGEMARRCGAQFRKVKYWHFGREERRFLLWHKVW